MPSRSEPAAVVEEHARARARREALLDAARRANRSPSVRMLARAGLVANGLLHLLIGALALRIAWAGEGTADQQSAFAAIERFPGGAVALTASAIASGGLALWQFTDAAWVVAPKRRVRAYRRLKDVAKAIGFAFVAAAMGLYALGARSGGSEAAERVSEYLLGTVGGWAILLAVGGTIGGVGIGTAYRGIARTFRDELSVRGKAPRRVVVTLGAVGYVAKGLALVVVGGLLVAAVVFADPHQAGGLDRALQYLADLPFGTVVLTVVAAGLATFGVYLFARARYLRS